MEMEEGTSVRENNGKADELQDVRSSASNGEAESMTDWWNASRFSLLSESSVVP